MHRYTVQVSKLGALRYLGHRDLARTFERALRRAGLPLQLTEGFRKHPRLILPEPLPLGVGSDAERYVIELTEELSADEVGERVRPFLPPGMGLLCVLTGVERDPLDTPITLEIDCADSEEVAQAVGALDLSAAEDLERVETLSVRPALTVRLVPPEGRRVSIGRFVRRLRQEVGSAAIRVVIRRV